MTEPEPQGLTWGQVQKTGFVDAQAPVEEVVPTTIISNVDAGELLWVLEMAQLGINANYFVTNVGEAHARLAHVREALGLGL